MYSGRPNSFKVGDWVYRLLPVAVTNVSRKLQVHWVGPFQVSRPVNKAQTEISVEGKLVLVHNGHLLKATGDKPPIVALQDVRRFLAEGHRFHNEKSQEFVRWQFAPNEVIVQQRTRGARQPPQSAAIGHTSYNASSAFDCHQPTQMQTEPAAERCGRAPPRTASGQAVLVQELTIESTRGWTCEMKRSKHAYYCGMLSYETELFPIEFLHA